MWVLPGLKLSYLFTKRKTERERFLFCLKKIQMKTKHVSVLEIRYKVHLLGFGLAKEHFVT